MINNDYLLTSYGKFSLAYELLKPLSAIRHELACVMEGL